MALNSSHMHMLRANCSQWTISYTQLHVYSAIPTPPQYKMDTLCLKVGSQSDARPCVALICKMQNFIIKAFFDNLTQERNAKEHKDRIQVYPSVTLCSYKRQRKGDAMQCIV